MKLIIFWTFKLFQIQVSFINKDEEEEENNTF